MLNLLHSQRFCVMACLWAVCAAGLSAPPQVHHLNAANLKTKTLTPQAAAFLQAISRDDAAVVGQMLKANPALANLPPSYDTGNSGILNDPPLSAAVPCGDIQVITLLLKAGAKVNVENEDEETPLDQAAFFAARRKSRFCWPTAQMPHTETVSATLPSTEPSKQITPMQSLCC